MITRQLKQLTITVVVWITILYAAPAFAQMNEPKPGKPVDQKRDVGIDPKLNGQIPMGAVFTDEFGKKVRLGDLLGKKPTVLNMIFYKCTGSCLLEGDGMVKVFRAMRFDIGKEYNVITVSINPTESPSLAMDKKESYLQAYARKSAPDGWHFLVGNRENINRLATALGFRFVYDPVKDQIAHATGIMVLTPDGRVSRYFMGVGYPATELRLSLVDASAGKIGTVVDAVVLYCSQFDPITGKRTLAVMNLMKIAGGVTVLALVLSISLMSLKNRRQSAEDVPHLTNGTAPHNA
jgi:protein SCO1/2